MEEWIVDMSDLVEVAKLTCKCFKKKKDKKSFTDFGLKEKSEMMRYEFNYWKI